MNLDANAVITRLGPADKPWLYAMRIVKADDDTFREFIEALKSTVANSERTWDPAGKRWLFRGGQTVELVTRLLERHGLSYIYDEDGDTRTQSPLTAEDAYAALCLRPGAPPELVQAAYRIMAKRTHPDAGGDTAAMQTINAAVKLLREMTR